MSGYDWYGEQLENRRMIRLLERKLIAAMEVITTIEELKRCTETYEHIIDYFGSVLRATDHAKSHRCCTAIAKAGREKVERMK